MSASACIVGPLSMTPVECMRIQIGEDGPSATASCDTTVGHMRLVPNIDEDGPEDLAENIPPLSSSPPELASSSPQSSHSGMGSSRTSVLSSPSGILPQKPGNACLGTVNSAQNFIRLSHVLERSLREKEQTYSKNIATPSRNDPSRPLSDDYEVQTVPSLTQLDRSCSGFISLRVASLSECEALPSTSPVDLDSTCYEPEDNSTSSGNKMEISPITFMPNPELQSSFSQSTANESPVYRVIKRALDTHYHGESLPKRTKLRDESVSHHINRVYAPRTASLRRADSLKTTSEFESESENMGVSGYTRPRQRRVPKENKTISKPVPIIAPPPNYVAGLPIGSDTLAKLRLQKFLEREADQRLRDGFSVNLVHFGTIVTGDVSGDKYQNMANSDATFLWEDALGIGKDRRLNAINWLLNVLPVIYERPAREDSPFSVASSDITPSSSISSSITYADQCVPVIHNLLDQLQTSRETRFHACWMFLRYFYLVMSPESLGRMASHYGSLGSQRISRLEGEGRDLVVFDIAVSCLSLSVKLHRDFLDPLLPVYAHEYLTLSPHQMSYDDLETAHRDVLSTFDYRLGVSPQLLMDELWLALPSLRVLLDLDGGWKYAMESAWIALLKAVREPDVQMFSISLLTTVAIMDGIISSTRFREIDSSPIGTVTPTVHCPALDTSARVLKTPRRVFEQMAREELEGVLCDIQALVGVTDVQLQRCREWMKQFE